MKTPDTACSLSDGYGADGKTVQPLERGQKPLFTDREICQATVLVGKPVVTWTMVQGRLRRVVEQDDGRKVRAGVTKKQWETVMKAATQAFPIATLEDEGKDVKIVFFAPPNKVTVVTGVSTITTCSWIAAR